MRSPDAAAAALTDADMVDTWKGAPLPGPDRTIELRTMVRDGNRTRTVKVRGVVSNARTVGDDLVVDIAEQGQATPRTYTLSASSLLTRWTYVGDTTPVVLLPSDDDEPTPFDDVEPSSPSVPVGDGSLVSIIREFIGVEARLDELEPEVKLLKRRKEELTRMCVDKMIDEGIDSPPGVDGMTAYLTPVYHVEKLPDPETGEPATGDQIVDAIRAAGLGDAMLKEGYNGNQLRSLLREYVEAKKPFPEALAAVVKLNTRLDLRVTPAGVSKRRAAPRHAT